MSYLPSYLRVIFWHSPPWIKNCKMSLVSEAPLSRFKAPSTILKKIKTPWQSLCLRREIHISWIINVMQCNVPWDAPDKQNTQNFAQTNCRRGLNLFRSVLIVRSYCLDSHADRRLWVEPATNILTNVGLTYTDDCYLWIVLYNLLGLVN